MLKVYTLISGGGQERLARHIRLKGLEGRTILQHGHVTRLEMPHTKKRRCVAAFYIMVPIAASSV